MIPELGRPLPTIALFLLFAGVTLYLTARARARTNSLSDFYVAGRTVPAPQNGLALFGNFLMFTSFLTMTGEIAIRGYDGVLFAVGFVVSFVVALLLVAEPVRNGSRYTIGDLFSVRLRERPVRLATAVVTLVVFFFYTMVQMVGAAGLAAPLLGMSQPSAQAAVVVVIGVLTTVYVFVGGMHATTAVQIFKAVLLILAVAILAMLVLVRWGGNLSALLGDAAARSGPDAGQWLSPGQKFGVGTHRWEFVSQLVTVVLGHAALPYLFLRHNTVPSAREARRSVAFATWLVTPFYLAVIVIGFGAAALFGAKAIMAAPGQRNSAAMLVAGELGGTPLLAFVGAVVLLTVVAVTAGLTISAAASFSHDIYASVLKRGRVDAAGELRVARRVVLALGVLSILGGLVFMRQNIAFMLSLDVTVVASTILPVLVFAIFWRRFNTSGALWSLYGGLALTVVLVAFSPAVSGNPMAMIPGADFAWFPWKYVGLVSIPAAFLLGYLGTVFSREHDDARFDVLEARILTGAGAQPAVEARPRETAAVR
ncbi:cation acetate symporter [Plantactinospora sp. S1510]|uniref:Cation acetate symporter n=1 Tax=Plantactinospora alkalitolerans TaxID=2789879 RepID=A0ABS0H7K4_9ACTN|nr:cation acetate symporter [Plantactinospora alkalitolerans]MBF9134450.1 cation acetate symporter [Plantactinospora alkalitolerans]